MKKKTILVSFLAVFMLLAVSLASAGTYTVRPALNNNVDVEEQVVVEEEQQISPEEIPIINPASLIFWGEATLDIHAELYIHQAGQQTLMASVRNGSVRVMPIIFLWLRILFDLDVTGNTDYRGNCQLQVPAPHKELGIEVFHRVRVVADISQWIDDPSGWAAGIAFVGVPMYAGESYTVEVEIHIRIPRDNVIQELVSQQSSSFQQLLISSISGQSSNR